MKTLGKVVFAIGEDLYLKIHYSKLHGYYYLTDNGQLVDISKNLDELKKEANLLEYLQR